MLPLDPQTLIALACSITSIIEPDQLNNVCTNLLLAQSAELSLLVHEEETALDDSKATSGVGGRSHQLDDVVG
jgi:hypothetical protein